MNRIDDIESQLKQLTSEELRSFREWFVQFDAGTWDRQFESDVHNGKLDELAKRALRDYKAGKTTEL